MFDLIIEGHTTEQTCDGLSEREVRARFAQHLAGAVQVTVIGEYDETTDTNTGDALTDELRLILSMNVTPEEIQAYAREVADTNPVSRNAWAATTFGEWFDNAAEANEFLAYKALVLAVADELIDDRIRGEMDTEIEHMTGEVPVPVEVFGDARWDAIRAARIELVEAEAGFDSLMHALRESDATRAAWARLKLARTVAAQYQIKLEGASAARLAQVRVNSALLEAEKIDNARQVKAYRKTGHTYRPNPNATAIGMGAVQRAVDNGATTVTEIVDASFVGRLRADMLRVLKNRGQL